nr:hypothetical protein [Chlamydiota bacterium]
MNPINPNQPSFQPPENLGSSLSDDDRNLIKEAHQYLDEFTASMQKLMVDLYDDGPDLKSDIQNFKQILGNLI